MAEKSSRVRLEFEIESLDPTRPTSQVISEVEALAADIQSQIQQQSRGTTVEIVRVEGLPLVPELQHILLTIDWDVVRKGAEQAIASFATTEFLKLLKDRIKNLRVKHVSPPPAQTGAPSSNRKPTRKAPPRSPKGSASKTRRASKGGKKINRKGAKKK